MGGIGKFSENIHFCCSSRYSAVNADVVHFFVDKTTRQPTKKEKDAAKAAGTPLIKKTERKLLAVSTDTKA